MLLKIWQWNEGRGGDNFICVFKWYAFVMFSFIETNILYILSINRRCRKKLFWKNNKFTFDFLVFWQLLSRLLYITDQGDGGTKIKTQPQISPITVPIDTSIGPCIILLVKLPIYHTKKKKLTIFKIIFIQLFYTIRFESFKNIILSTYQY